MPKNGDNFDARYCNQAERIGNETKEKYDNYLRNDTLKEAFRCFTYYPAEGKEQINFNNPHINISNCLGSGYSLNNFDNSTNLGNSTISGVGNLNASVENRVKMERSASIENKFLKIKKQSNSASTSSLLRQYRQSNNSQNSTGASVNYMNRRSGSTFNNNY